MTYAQVKAYINQFIITNGNNEITAIVLNPILQAITDMVLEITGDKSTLSTANKNTLVEAINEVYGLIGGIGNDAPHVYQGEDDPNTTPPPIFTIGDFYIQTDPFNEPIALFLYDGVTWVNISIGSSPNLSDYINDVPFATVAYVDNILSNQSLSGAKRKGDVLYGILDQYTGEEITLEKTTDTNAVDGVIYFDLGIEKFKRNFTFLNVKWFGAIGNGIDDDTVALQKAHDSNENQIVYYPNGIYRITSTVNITNNSSISGQGQKSTIILVDFNGGYGIDISGGYYDNPNLLENFTISLKTPTTQTTSGVNVNKTYWGINILVRNVSNKYFTDISWNIRESFNSVFENVITIGYEESGTRFATLLNFEKSDTFSNSFLARNSLFFLGKIGIKNLGCASSAFKSCTFESINLFLNVEAILGVTVLMNFSECWFEIIQYGIINSQLDGSTLNPLLPLAGKTNLDRISFSNNYTSASTPLPFVNATVEPYKSNYFTIEKGYAPTSGFVPQYLEFTEVNGLPADSTPRVLIGTYDLTNLTNPTGFGNRSFLTVKVTCGVNGGNEMSALYLINRVGSTPTLIGSIDDPYSFGVSYKIQLSWSGASLIVDCDAQGLYLIKTDICTLGNLG